MTDILTQHHPTTLPSLDRDNIVVLEFNVKATQQSFHAAYSVLNNTEQARADRFHFAKDRQNWALGRALTRKALSHYSRLPMSRILLHQTGNNKPILRDSESTECNSQEIQFNLSHSGHRAVLAISRCFDPGIDIEKIDLPSNWIAVAERVFSVSELAALKQQETAHRALSFSHLWTCKEALIKATGDGFSADLPSIEISPDPLGKPTLLSWADEPNEDEWMLSRITPPLEAQPRKQELLDVDYVATLAARCPTNTAVDCALLPQ